MAEPGQLDQASPACKVDADVLLNEPRSFRMDRRSPEAAALRDAVSRKHLDFLGAYSDDVLTVETKDGYLLSIQHVHHGEKNFLRKIAVLMFVLVCT
ncbi:uncharacterized protein LOC122008875 isoform X2 [Zingiber officinale]|uniref:uncharacterized protein LOC122008875 isoform X2 n=1 Tax=Zingiber officinale TaxID=94328 RepID=UPI001C4B621C|nr:uncharacterized protein LOC122008875 isoform X2 [Zingiber officinale]XP_042420707.1 uncharacterized protein LOC122008875 isoform X2 [Zingiber officinale]